MRMKLKHISLLALGAMHQGCNVQSGNLWMSNDPSDDEGERKNEVVVSQDHKKPLPSLTNGASIQQSANSPNDFINAKFSSYCTEKEPKLKTMNFDFLGCFSNNFVPVALSIFECFLDLTRGEESSVPIKDAKQVSTALWKMYDGALLKQDCLKEKLRQARRNLCEWKLTATFPKKEYVESMKECVSHLNETLGTCELKSEIKQGQPFSLSIAKSLSLKYEYSRHFDGYLDGTATLDEYSECHQLLVYAIDGNPEFSLVSKTKSIPEKEGEIWIIHETPGFRRAEKEGKKLFSLGGYKEPRFLLKNKLDNEIGEQQLNSKIDGKFLSTRVTTSPNKVITIPCIKADFEEEYTITDAFPKMYALSGELLIAFLKCKALVETDSMGGKVEAKMEFDLMFECNISKKYKNEPTGKYLYVNFSNLPKMVFAVAVGNNDSKKRVFSALLSKKENTPLVKGSCEMRTVYDFDTNSSAL